jgi:hypothetical protein
MSYSKTRDALSVGNSKGDYQENAEEYQVKYYNVRVTDEVVQSISLLKNELSTTNMNWYTICNVKDN